MKRFAVICWLVTGAAAALVVFQVSHDVQRLEAELAITKRNILSHQEALHVLRAEWSYLNQPGQIADLAERHLDLRPLSSDQFVELQNLPLRSAPAADDEAPETGGGMTPTLATMDDTEGRKP